MRKTSLPNVTLITVAASYLIQVGAGVFALAVIAPVLTAAPPRSFAILQGPYRYDSSAFWQTVPPITGALLLIAIVANWRTLRRSMLLSAFALFVGTSLATVLYLEPLFGDVVGTRYQDSVDLTLQSRAAMWYTVDWLVRGVDAVACIILLVALTRPATNHALPAH